MTTQRASHALGPDFAGVALVTLVVLEFAIGNARPGAEELPGWIAAGVEDASPSKLCLLAGALGFGGGGLEGAMAAWALWELKNWGSDPWWLACLRQGSHFSTGVVSVIGVGSSLVTGIGAASSFGVRSSSSESSEGGAVSG